MRRKARKEEKERKGKKQERKATTQESGKKKVITFATSRMLVTFGATTRTWACTCVYVRIRQEPRISRVLPSKVQPHRKRSQIFTSKPAAGRWQTEEDVDAEVNAGKCSKDFSGGKNDYSGGKNTYNKNPGKSGDQWQQQQWWDPQWASSSGDGWWQPDPWAPQQPAWGPQQEWGKGWKQQSEIG